MIKKIEDLKIKIFSDGADKKDMLDMNSKTFLSAPSENIFIFRSSIFFIIFKQHSESHNTCDNFH
jgi:hypothetical protein